MWTLVIYFLAGVVLFALGLLLGSMQAKRKLLQVCKICQMRRKAICTECEHGTLRFQMLDAKAEEDMRAADARDEQRGEDIR